MVGKQTVGCQAIDKYDIIGLFKVYSNEYDGCLMMLNDISKINKLMKH